MEQIFTRNYLEKDKTVIKKYMTNEDNHHYVKDIDDKNRNNLIVAEYNSAVVGYLYMVVSAGNCQVFIYVSPEYRRVGIGTVLCHEAEKKCSQKGEKEMWGYYYESNSIKFTEKLGFYFTTSTTNIRQDYNWSSSNSSIAYVDQYGIVHAVSSGTFIIICVNKFNSSYIGQITITVV